MRPARDMIEAGHGGVYVDVYALLHARRTRVVGRHGHALKVAVAAPPTGGKANEAFEGAMAESFGVPRRNVSPVSGQSARRKRFFVQGVDQQEARLRIDAALTDAAT